jgi:predicted O-linked N-acetylglucosamine transferase (SPINDLY family)
MQPATDNQEVPVGPTTVTDLLQSVQGAVELGRREDALQIYENWIQSNSNDPLLHAVLFNFGTLLLENKSYPKAIEIFEQAIAREPSFFPPYINLGNCYERNGQADKAIDAWTRVANFVPQLTGVALNHKLTALKQIARVFETARLESDAEETLARSLEINGQQRDVIQHWIALRQSQCKWPAIVETGQVETRDLWASISPLSLAVECDDLIFQLANAYRYYWLDVAQRTPALPRPVADLAPTTRPIRVGYLSSDLREHAVGFLMSEVFELHDRRKVEVYAYYCGIQTVDAVQARFKASCDHWVDISGLTDKQAIEQICADKIDILVDLNGYTKDARLKVVAARPAPIIVNWLGFPGTMGSPHHNYIIADPIIIPKESEPFYAERVVRLSCYQPNDRQRYVNPVRPTREQAGLPKDKFIYCCFNSSQKYRREVFDDWLQILQTVPDSILWLLSGQSQTNDRLKKYATDQGLDADRIVFAPRQANPDHLARFGLADVFLDTSPYGAHTTASDALWMGVPVITRIGTTFAARVCASLLTAAGLQDLVCQTREQYIETAVTFASDSRKYALAREHLVRNRDSVLLFDTPRLVRELEGCYSQMREDLIAGRLPQPDLSNLDALAEVAIDVPRDAPRSLREQAKIYGELLIRRGCVQAGLMLSTQSQLKVVAEAVAANDCGVIPTTTETRRVGSLPAEFQAAKAS